MSYFRRSMGDGPITDPVEVDEGLLLDVVPTRVPCDQLPADSPWKRPGQVCAPSSGGGPLDFLQKYFTDPGGAGTMTASSQSGEGSSVSPWLLLAGAGAVAYYLHRKKRRGA